MSSYVENIVALIGDEQEIRKMLETIKSDEYGLGTIDFNKIIPMPENLNIEAGSRTGRGLKIYQDFIDIYKFGKKAKEAKQMLENISAESEAAFLKARSDCHNDVDPKDWELGKAAWHNLRQYGVSTWYDWRLQNWGTNKNACGYEENIDYSANEKLQFQTAWFAPHPIIKRLSELFPAVMLEHRWAEDNIGESCGCHIYLDGEIIDECLPEDEEQTMGGM